MDGMEKHAKARPISLQRSTLALSIVSLADFFLKTQIPYKRKQIFTHILRQICVV
jgi:hypothetical protein